MKQPAVLTKFAFINFANKDDAKHVYIFKIKAIINSKYN